MDAKLQGYIDKLNALNFKEMYNGDFFLTWEKTDDEIEAVFTVADALRYMRENNISTRVFESGLGISYSVITLHVHVSLSLLLVTFLVLRFRILTKENLRLLMVRQFVRQLT